MVGTTPAILDDTNISTYQDATTIIRNGMINGTSELDVIRQINGAFANNYPEHNAFLSGRVIVEAGPVSIQLRHTPKGKLQKVIIRDSNNPDPVTYSGNNIPADYQNMFHTIFTRGITEAKDQVLQTIKNNPHLDMVYQSSANGGEETISYRHDGRWVSIEGSEKAGYTFKIAEGPYMGGIKGAPRSSFVDLELKKNDLGYNEISNLVSQIEGIQQMRAKSVLSRLEGLVGSSGSKK